MAARLHFGPDGKLYVAVGENANGAYAQSLNNRLGKILRINSDGIDSFGQPVLCIERPGRTARSGRSAFATRSLSRSTLAGTQMLINDVGENTWEEIDDGVAGANYGWPDDRGADVRSRASTPEVCCTTTPPAARASPEGRSTPRLRFGFRPTTPSDYFFADYCAGWIRKLDPSAGNAVGTFRHWDFVAGRSESLRRRRTGPPARVDQGRRGVVRRIEYGRRGRASLSSGEWTVAPGASATFSVSASGAATIALPMATEWCSTFRERRRRTTRLPPVIVSDNGGQFRAMVSNDFGSVPSAIRRRSR